MQIKTFFTPKYTEYPIQCSAYFYPIYNTACCHGVLSQINYLNYKKAVRIITCGKYNATEPLSKTLDLLNLKTPWKQKHQNYIIDTNEINFPDILIQCSRNQMIIVHIILDINLFYIYYQQRQALGGFRHDWVIISHCFACMCQISERSDRISIWFSQSSPRFYPDSNVDVSSVGPKSVLPSRRWANFSATFITVWVLWEILCIIIKRFMQSWKFPMWYSERRILDRTRCRRFVHVSIYM